MRRFIQPGALAAVLAALIGFLGFNGTAIAQTESPAAASAAEPTPRSSGNNIYLLNQERFYVESLFGKRVRADISALSAELVVENDQIAADLEAEEKTLTETRSEMTAQEFRALADAFDAKVEEIRQTQTEKTNKLNTWADTERQRFFQLAIPVLVELSKELQAHAILDRRIAIISSDQIDLTSLAIERVDAAIADGSE